MNNLFSQKNIASHSDQRGFTLIEMIVSLALFISVMTVAAASMLSIIDANRKSQATNTVVDNLSFVVDEMTRTLMTGKGWAVLSSGAPSVPNAKISVAPQGVAVGDPNLTVFYYLDNGRIMKQVGSGTGQPLTGSNVVVDVLKFFLDIQSPGGPAVQPYVHLLVRAHVNDKAKYRSDINISTTISQRSLNR